MPLLMFNDDPQTSQDVLHVRIQQIPGRRQLTIIEGIPAEKRAEVYDFLKKKLACGGANKTEEGMVQLMGDHSFAIKELLRKMLPEYSVIIHGKKV